MCGKNIKSVTNQTFFCSSVVKRCLHICPGELKLKVKKVLLSHEYFIEIQMTPTDGNVCTFSAFFQTSLRLLVRFFFEGV